jgi:uncharacterized protein DUF3303
LAPFGPSATIADKPRSPMLVQVVTRLLTQIVALRGGPMLSMVIEKFKNQNGKAVYRKQRASGRGLPEGPKFVASYVSADLSRRFQLMETDDVTLFQRWIADWQSLVEFEAVPVVEDKSIQEALTPSL